MEQQEFDFSVLVITYNHQRFIRQCLDSILQQQFTGKIQVVIGIDKCADSTLEICRDYQQRYPNLVELLVHEQNVGMYRNFCETLRRCQGKYIAILEGDDYWTDPSKLQLQYDFFEEHPFCVLSAGYVELVNEHSNKIGEDQIKLKTGTVLLREEIIIINRLHTLTVAFRKSAIRWDQLEKLDRSPHLDWGIFIMLIYPGAGFAYKFPKFFGAYRLHNGGIYSQIDEQKRIQNVLKTIFYNAQLDLEPIHRDYLQTLFANYAMKLQSPEFLQQEPYRSFYDRRRVIYNKGHRLKTRFVGRLYRHLFSFLKRNGYGRVRLILDLELLRQTRRSRKDLFHPLLLPVVPFYFLLRTKDIFHKTRLYIKK